MQDILLNEICDKCKKQLTLMESVRTEDGSLWLVKRCLSCFARPVEEVVMVCASINEPVPPARLQEICEAERDGRCFTPPFKLGDTVFDITEFIEHIPSPEIYLVSANEITIKKLPSGKILFEIDSNEYFQEDFGKKAFFSKEAAEDAAKGR